MPTTEGSQTDFEALNKYLDSVELVYHDLILNERLLNSQIERWRWDVPSIALTWIAKDRIYRNINSYLQGTHRDDSMQLIIEGNAWLDQDVEEGKVRIRRWRHHESDSLRIKFADHEPQVAEAVFEAYRLAIEWTYDDLREEEILG